jgi:hypothetical protein
LPTILKNGSTIICGIIISFFFNWKLGLIGLVAMPFILASGYILMKFLSGGLDN